MRRRAVSARAICAKVCPRAAGYLRRPRILPSVSSVSRSGDSVVGRLALEPSGIPSRYLSVSMPWASGEKPIQPTPRSPTCRGVRARSSGSASSTTAGGSTAGSPGRAGSRRPRPSARRVRRDSDVESLPLAHRASSAPIVSSSGVSGSKRWGRRCRRIRGPAREALVEARDEVLAGAPFTIRAWPHVVPAFVEMTSSSRYGARSSCISRPKFSSAEPYGGP